MLLLLPAPSCEIRDIPGFEGRYAASADGHIWSYKRPRVPGHWLKHGTHKAGYSIVALWTNNRGKTFRVHRLVALAWIENPLCLPFINHKDGIKKNNAVENLEWCTRSHNGKHAWATGLRTVTDKSRAASRRTIEYARSFQRAGK